MARLNDWGIMAINVLGTQKFWHIFDSSRETNACVIQRDKV